MSAKASANRAPQVWVDRCVFWWVERLKMLKHVSLDLNDGKTFDFFLHCLRSLGVLASHSSDEGFQKCQVTTWQKGFSKDSDILVLEAHCMSYAEKGVMCDEPRPGLVSLNQSKHRSARLVQYSQVFARQACGVGDGHHGLMQTRYAFPPLI